ncbi:MAG: hypothetical protein H0U27_02370, partial [Nitrosopumilus sp.]|nr:hypothetical protein [Nitrosopumilus sp.]
YLPAYINLLSQGEIVAKSLEDYFKRHPEIERRISKKQQKILYTTDLSNDLEKTNHIYQNRKFFSFIKYQIKIDLS